MQELNVGTVTTRIGEYSILHTKIVNVLVIPGTSEQWERMGEDKCYVIIQNQQGFTKAIHDCVIRKGHLVSIDDEEVQKYVVSKFRQVLR